MVCDCARAATCASKSTATMRCVEIGVACVVCGDMCQQKADHLEIGVAALLRRAPLRALLTF